MNTDNFQWNDTLVQEFCNWFCRIPAHEVYKIDRIKQFKEIKKIPSPFVLITEDKVQIKIGEAVSVLNINNWDFNTWIADRNSYHPNDDHKYFSNHERRLEYLRKYQPCLCINDIEKIISPINDLTSGREVRHHLYELIKSKISGL